MTSPSREVGLFGQVALAAWLVFCFATYILQGTGHFPPWLDALLTAAYQQ